MLHDQAAAEPLDLLCETIVGLVRRDEPDLTARQFAAYLVVYRFPGPHTIRSLSLQLRVARPVMTRAVNVLAGSQMVRRRTDPEDLRSVLIERSRKGSRYLRDIEAIMDDALTRTGSRLEFPGAVSALEMGRSFLQRQG